jgi:hypothetical protein
VAARPATLEKLQQYSIHFPHLTMLRYISSFFWKVSERVVTDLTSVRNTDLMSRHILQVDRPLRPVSLSTEQGVFDGEIDPLPDFKWQDTPRTIIHPYQQAYNLSFGINPTSHSSQF